MSKGIDENKNAAEQKADVLEMERLELLAEFYRSFGDVTRLRILNVLARQEICVGDLSNELGMTQSAVSHQLRLLKQNRLIKGRRDGKQINYSLDDDHVRTLLEAGEEHIREQL